VENSRGQLVTSGLYAYIRHPLYVASFLIGLGLCLILGDLVVLAAYLPVYVAMHAWVIHGEEQWLAQHWGDDYRRYAARVPASSPARAAGATPSASAPATSRAPSPAKPTPSAPGSAPRSSSSAGRRLPMARTRWLSYPSASPPRASSSGQR